MARTTSHWSGGGSSSILATRRSASFGLAPSTPATKPAKNPAVSGSRSEPNSLSARTASGTREGSGLWRQLSIQPTIAARERNLAFPDGAALACEGGGSALARMASPNATDA